METTATGTKSFVLRKKKRRADEFSEASQVRLIAGRFFRHKLAVVGLVLLTLFYLSAIFAPFLTQFHPQRCFDEFVYAPPQRLRFADENGFSLRPFYYGMKKVRNPETLAMEYQMDKTQRHYIHFFEKGYEYKLLGLIPTDVHLFMSEEASPLFIFGTDSMGRDLMARNTYASRISMTICLVGVAITFVLGCFFGGISGYYGGAVDLIVQRIIEFLMSIPTLPLWMALSAALPRSWSQVQLYLAITVVLALSGWTGLARVVRGKLISLRSADYVTAARLSGVSNGKIISKHLLPGFAGYLIVNITITIPNLILGETSLSFMGLGLQPPTVSWGVLLGEAQNIKTIALYPWIMIPGLFVVLVVLAFNFVGDGLRDAVDPYKEG